MDDQKKWQKAVAGAYQRYDRLPADTGIALDGLIAGIIQLKQELFELAQVAGGGDICRTCGGQCCRYGKYHVTVLDLLAYRSAGVEPLMPDFATPPCCPYGGPDGCRMEPRFRSMTCLIFNCDLLEERMVDDVRQRFAAAEGSLRAAVARAEQLLGYRAGRALLLSLEQ